MDDWKAAVEQYCAYIQHIRNHTRTTVSGARSTFRLIARELDIERVSDLTRDRIEEWLLAGRVEKGWKSATYVCHHKRLKGLFRWLKERGKIEANPLDSIGTPKLEQSLPRRLSREEAERLLLGIRRMKTTYAFERSRNLALVAVMVYAWLRRTEALQLSLDDLDLRRMTVTVVQGKGRKDRIVPVCTALAGILCAYLEERKRVDRRCRFFFTPAQKDSRLNDRGLRRIFERVQEAVGMRFSPHVLRHTFATLMLEGGCDLYTLSRMMGHSKITTTTIYLGCSPEQMLRSIEKHPLN